MRFGKALGTACSTFAITNIDDLFVLVTFFAESSIDKRLTPLKIALGQYAGFTVIVAISMVGFAAAQAIPAEPIGFLGLLPLLIGFWKLLDLVVTHMFESRYKSGSSVDVAITSIPTPTSTSTSTSTDATATLKPTSASIHIKIILKVASITVMNGGDNISTYIPVFSQANRSELPIYIITYYTLLGIWCLAAYAIMKQRHILAVAQRYARVVVPLLYIGLGTFIVVKSGCYPWSVRRINERFDESVRLLDPGGTIMAGLTAFLLLACVGSILSCRLRVLDARAKSASRVDSAERTEDVELQAAGREGYVDADVEDAGIHSTDDSEDKTDEGIVEMGDNAVARS